MGVNRERGERGYGEMVPVTTRRWSGVNRKRGERGYGEMVPVTTRRWSGVNRARGGEGLRGDSTCDHEEMVGCE